MLSAQPRRSLLWRDPLPKNLRTVSDQVANHIAHLTGVTDGTRARYSDYLRRRIDGHSIGSTPLHLLDRDTIASWVNWLAKEGLSAKTIKNHHSLISASLTSAVRSQLIPTNFAEGIRIATPTDEGEEMVTLTLTELWEFINATSGALAPDGDVPVRDRRPFRRGVRVAGW